jgi:ornithine cyclodeaminase
LADAEQALRVYRLSDLEPRLNKKAVINAVRASLIAHAKGMVQSPMPGHLVFPEANGDCHIKFGQMAGSPTFAIKVATGFYNNPERGLPANNGLIIIFDAQTGVPVSLFQDEGWLTAWRTAAATALAAELFAPGLDPVIGIIGTGLQAQLAVQWIPELIPAARFVMHGRDPSRASSVAAAAGAKTASTIEELLAVCDVVVTATSSAQELFSENIARPGTHFVGVGADGPEKAELPVGLFARAAHILVDCPKQCLVLSDFGRACSAGKIAPAKARLFGDVLAGQNPKRQREDITIVDLTGLAAQDIAVANLFAKKLRATGFLTGLKQEEPR